MQNDARAIPTEIVENVDHWIPMLPSRYSDDTDMWNSTDRMQIRMYSRYAGHVLNFTIMFQSPGGAYRRVFQGPQAPGPFAPLIPQTAVISAYRDPNPPTLREAHPGDTVLMVCIGTDRSLTAYTGVLTDDRRHDYPYLADITQVLAEPPAAR